MRLGAVHLIVNDLERMLGFYQTHLGLQVHWNQGNSVGLGAGGEDLLVLEEDKTARKQVEAADIYHFALYMPDRMTLARMVARLYTLRWRNSPTDHLVSEATYLEDPEGNTVELTHETPERGVLVIPDDGTRPYALGTDGHRQGVSEAIDVDALLSILPKDIDLTAPLPGATRIHHVHLYASSLVEMDRFYREVIGFRRSGFSTAIRMADYGPEGYPVHMLAFNTWRGEGIPPKWPDSAGLKYFTFVPDDPQGVLGRLRDSGIGGQEVDGGFLVHDPSGLGLLLVTG